MITVYRVIFGVVLCLSLVPAMILLVEMFLIWSLQLGQGLI